MIENKQSKKISKNNKWIIYAVLSAIFAAFTSVLAKIGISNVESNLGTAIHNRCSFNVLEYCFLPKESIKI